MSRFWKAVFGLLVLSGIFAALVRFGKGLGAATNLSDEFPWGLWIGFDVLVGVGLAAGGFVIAATVHVFQIKRYEAIARPAILTAFLGYLLVIVAILFDIGHPYRIWHPLVMGNPHSVMFEVAMCVMLYTMVLGLEFSPLLFARLGLKLPMKIVRAAYIPLVVAGVLLSTLHQSSLGTLYVIVPDKLHALWYTPLLPVFFFLSAIAGGLAMTIFESFMSYRAFGKRLEADLLDGIARVIVVVLGVLLVWRLGNLADRGAVHFIFEVTPESVMFWGEMVLGIILPMILFALPRVRTSQNGLFLGSVLVIIGFITGRLNVAITGFVGSSGVNYIPSWMEAVVTASIFAVGPVRKYPSRPPVSRGGRAPFSGPTCCSSCGVCSLLGFSCLHSRRGRMAPLLRRAIEL
jgi:Ni/Fe-hydrogenase subunit HybB-like protein